MERIADWSGIDGVDESLAESRRFVRDVAFDGLMFDFALVRG